MTNQAFLEKESTGNQPIQPIQPDTVEQIKMSTHKLFEETALAEIEALRQTEKLREEIGLDALSFKTFDTLAKACNYMKKRSKIAKAPLAIKMLSETEYRVHEAFFTDADGVPVSDGDIMFTPDNRYFRIDFGVKFDDLFYSTLVEDNKHLVLYKGKPVDGDKVHMPEEFGQDRNYSTFILVDENNSCQSRWLRHRAWTDNEKIEYIRYLTDKSESKLRRISLKGLTICSSLLALLVFILPLIHRIPHLESIRAINIGFGIAIALLVLLILLASGYLLATSDLMYYWFLDNDFMSYKDSKKLKTKKALRILTSELSRNGEISDETMRNLRKKIISCGNIGIRWEDV